MADERKTLEQRAQMTDLERLRHSAAHVLATAILRIWPEAQFAAGPPVENGFYYDVELPHRISPEDFEKIEAEMKKEIESEPRFRARRVLPRRSSGHGRSAANLARLVRRPEPSKFKLDIIQNIPEGEEISLYRNGEFTDLCAGPHVMRTGNIGAFKLTHVASAYYKGDEKNPQLQRIYGTAFKNKTQLDDYFAMLEEAKKRDHRKLGKELELFTFDDDVGPGLPLWLPRGTAIIEELEKLAKETEFAAGYQRVRTPNLAREKLIPNKRPPSLLRGLDVPADGARCRRLESKATDASPEDSGRCSRSREPRKRLDEILAKRQRCDRATDRSLLPQSDELPASSQALRCGAAQLSRPAAAPRRIRHLLPLRTERRTLRPHARALAADERRPHLLHARSSSKTEFNAVNEMYLNYFKIFGIEKYVMRFSTHDPAKLGQKFVDDPELWKQDRRHGPRRPPAQRHQLRRSA